MDKNLPLPLWYDEMIGSPVKMALFVVGVLLLWPLLIIYGALLPIFYRSK